LAFVQDKVALFMAKYKIGWHLFFNATLYNTLRRRLLKKALFFMFTKPEKMAKNALFYPFFAIFEK
jgi:hypothetical protein